jgi:lambda family phage portal protein
MAAASRRGEFLRNAWASVRDSVRDFFFHPPQNRYEGAHQTWGERSWLPGAVQDARFDADQATRTELVRRSRYWERNNAIVNRLADVFEQYTVGQGLQQVPSCVDEDGKPLKDWNIAAARWWNDWCKFPDVCSGQPFGVMQGQMARALFVDGEIFIYKTFSRESGRPRIQLIESHRIETPSHLKHLEGKSIIDGIEFATDPNGNAVGRPKAYWVRIDTTPASGNVVGVWDPIDASRMIHLCDPSRPGMVRPLPMLYPVMNDLHDLDDLQKYEMAAAKSNAEVASVVTNKTGEADTRGLRRAKYEIGSQNAGGSATTKQAPLFYEHVTQGGKRVYISNGEKFEEFRTDRPGAATQSYWDYLVRKICAGVGISSLLVLPFSLQGTVTRADLDVASAFFKAKSSLISAALREIYVWALGWAVKFDRSLDGAPREWWAVTSRPPRSPNVDVGRNSYAVISELKAGIRNYQDVCAELGGDWRDVLRQRAIEASFIKDLTNEFGVTKEDIVLFGDSQGNAEQNPSETTPQAPGIQNPEEPQKKAGAPNPKKEPEDSIIYR